MDTDSMTWFHRVEMNHTQYDIKMTNTVKIKEKKQKQRKKNINPYIVILTL